jgi:hypothetical protein
MAVQTRIQVRRGTLSQWNAAAATLGNGILYQGEIGYETDTGRFKIGDGSTAWATLNYGSVRSVTGVSGIIATTDSAGAVTISLNDPTIQVADITDFAEGVDDRVNALLQAGTNISLSYNDSANTLTINSALGNEEIQDAIGTYISGVSGIAVSYNDTTGYTTISLSDPTIQVSDITDFTSGVNSLIDSAVSTSIVAGSGIDIVYNNGNNTLTVSSPLTAGSGISLSHSNGNYVVSLSDPTIELSNITDLSSNARNFLLTPSSSNLSTLVSDETGSGSLVFSNSPTLSGVTVNGNLTVGGSGLVASNINNFDTAVRTSRLNQMAAPTGSVSLNSQKITNLATPTDDSDAATKAYVDAARAGLDVKQSVRVATTSANSGLSISGLQTIDGVTLVAGDRVLVKDHAEPKINGIWVAASGSWSRAADANSSEEVTAGMFTFVSEGTVNADSGWVLTTNDPITIDGVSGTALNFAQFSGAGQITAGDGLTKSGNTINVVGTAGRIVANADSVDLDTVSRTDTTGSPGASFVQTVTTDSYGRVTAVTTGSISSVDGGSP